MRPASLYDVCLDHLSRGVSCREGQDGNLDADGLKKDFVARAVQNLGRVVSSGDRKCDRRVSRLPYIRLIVHDGFSYNAIVLGGIFLSNQLSVN